MGGTPSQVWVGLLPHTRSGGYSIPGQGVPHPRSGGYPIPGLGWYPIPVLGGTPSQVWGYPIPGLGWVVPCPRGGGYPILGLDGGYTILLTGGTPCQIQIGGYPIPGLDGGVSHSADGGYPIQDRGKPFGTPPVQHWMGYPSISKASTCYAVGGVPLAFTQEDFLVCSISTRDPFKLLCGPRVTHLSAINLFVNLL